MMICVKNLSRTNFLFDHQWVSPECRSLNSESVDVGRVRCLPCIIVV